MRFSRSASPPSGRCTFPVLAACVLPLLTLAGCDDILDPQIGLVASEARVEFRAIRGSSTPVTRTIQVTNAGGGRLGPVTCSSAPAGWLGCSVSGGNSVTFTADPSGLAEAPAPVEVILTAPGASTTVEVELVLEQPAVSVSPRTLTFTASEVADETTPASATVTVTNTGAGELQHLGVITCEPEPPTSRVGCVSGQTAGTLVVTVDHTDLEPGTFVYSLTVAGEHAAEAQTVTVTLLVASVPRLGLSRQSVHFETIRGSEAVLTQTVTASNLGGGELGTVSCPPAPAPWLACSVSGTTVTLSADPAGLVANPAPVSVEISATQAVNTPQAVEVRLALEQPVLSLDRSALSFKAMEDSTFTTPAQDTVVVSNTGAGTLENLGTIECTPPEDAPVTCTPDAATGVLTVSVNPVGLSRGSHTFPVEVSAPHSGVSRTLAVTVSVAPPATMVLAPSALHFRAIRGSTTALSDTVEVMNAGADSVGVIGCPPNPASWLTCVVVDSTSLLLTANPTGLTSSPPPVDVEVTGSAAANSPVELPVSFAIEQPVLELSATSVSFTAVEGQAQTTPTSRVVTVSNPGVGDRDDLGTIACSAAAPVACTVDQGTGEVTLTVDPSGRAQGTHVFSATVSAPHASNGSVTVTIVLEVTP